MDSMTVAISHIAQNEQMKKRSLDYSNERFSLKKGGYLLSRIALLNTVYHRCMDGMVAAIFKTSQNQKDLRDFSPRSSLRKKAATYSPALHCSTIGASGLNFSVRNGKRWNPTAITT